VRLVSPEFRARRGTKLKESNFRVTPKYYEIHAVNSDYRPVYSFWLDNHIESIVKSLCGLK